MTLFDLTCRVLAPDEFRDVPRYLDSLVSSAPAVGAKWRCSEPNVTPMRPPKRNTLTFTVAVRSIPKCIGSIKIDISKQNRSDQLFEFQTEERILPPWWRTKYHQTSVVLSLTWSSLSWIIDPQAFTTATPYFVDNSEIEIGVSIPQVFPKKFTRRKQRWTAKISFHAIDLSE